VDHAVTPRAEVPLSGLTTLELGGPARALVEIEREGDLVEALRWAGAEGLPAIVLGGGSNVVVADDGYPGLVVRMATRGVDARRDADETSVLVTAAAGEVWDDFVAGAVEERWGGLECMSGIPGTVGATPIQNVGAYGQEVGDVVVSARVLDRGTFGIRELSGEECGFGYRDSVFRRASQRFVVLAVTYRLRPHAPGTVRYSELARHLGPGSAAPSLAAVREAVIELRRSKSMVLEPSDPNRRSVGSFFVNPLVTREAAGRVVSRACELGDAVAPENVPAHEVGGGMVKLPAAWLVEHAGFPTGTRRGPVGVSSRHSLALVHHGGGTSAALISLAREIRGAVAERYGVQLEPEPVFVGFPGAGPMANSQGVPPASHLTRPVS